MDDENYDVKCEYEGDSDKLRHELFNLLRPQDRIDKMIVERYKRSTQGNFPNTKITIIFYAAEGTHD